MLDALLDDLSQIMSRQPVDDGQRFAPEPAKLLIESMECRADPVVFVQVFATIQ
jgi:hypothetical protein